MVINKYNNLINEYNELKNSKENEIHRRISDLTNSNINDYSFNNNNRNKVINPKLLSINNYNDKKNNNTFLKTNMKNISIPENYKNLNCFDNEYINRLKKENERLKKLIIKYEYTNKTKMVLNKNPNKNKISANILKERNTIYNKKINKINERKSRHISKNSSKEHSYIINYFKNKHNSYNINNKSDILLLMNKTNYSIIPKKKLTTDSITITNDETMTIKQNKKITNNFYNTISSSSNKEFFNGSIIKKNRTCINSSNKKGIKSNITNKRMINKLKVKCKEYLLNNEKINNISAHDRNSYLSNDKNINKYTPKHIIGNKENYLSHSNNNFSKIKNKLKSLNILDFENNSVFNSNTIDNKNNTASNYFLKDKNNLIKNHINRLNTDTNINNNSNLVIHRNLDNQKISKFKLIKEFKTEKDIYCKNVNNNNNNLLNINNVKESSLNKNRLITINKKNIFTKKLKTSIKNKEENYVKIKNKPQIINNSNTKNKLIFNNSLNNCLSSNDIGNTMNNNDKQMNLKHNKKKTPFIENSYINNEQLKSQNNTINNINNFNSCNYIYLLNNGDKFIKINRQFKI